MTIYKSTIQLLRIPFSINLLPIFLFAVYGAAGNIVLWKAGLVFLLIHFVFYPASNAYNSYMDRDEGAIAGIEHPPAPTRQLFLVSIVLDMIGLLLSTLVSLPFALINLILVLLSRAYSWRRIRIKQYAILGFLMVAMAQGGLSYYNMYLGIQGLDDFPILSEALFRNSVIASLFVGAIYPLTQIYQHEDDAKDGVNTISRMVGVRGTFVLSGCLFLMANVLLALTLTYQEFIIFELAMIAPVGFFLYWFIISWKNPSHANFQNTMYMALGASLAMILGFAVILIVKFT